MMFKPRMEHRILQVLLFALGGAAIGIGLMVFLLGAQAVNVVQSVFDSITGRTASPQTITPTIDSEMRFYSTLWFSYGVLLIWVARTMAQWVARTVFQRMRIVLILAAIFFAGGIGRLLSHLLVGAPHPVFTVLMVIELVYPVVLGVLYLRLRS
jgi:hypothetical protein